MDESRSSRMSWTASANRSLPAIRAEMRRVAARREQTAESPEVKQIVSAIYDVGDLLLLAIMQSNEDA